MGRGKRQGQGRAGLSPAELTTLATYESRAEDWGNARSTPDFWLPELPAFRSLCPSGRVLDVGSGNGRDAVLLSDQGYQVTGLDISPALLELAREREPRATFVEGSVYELPFADAEFQGAWAAASLLHLPKARIQEALSEIHRVLAASGGLFVAVKEGEGEEIEEGPFGERFFAYWQDDELRAEIERAGLRVSQSHTREAFGVPWLCLYASR